MPCGRTSMPGLQATDLLATLPACSGRRHNQLCRRHHECKLGDQTRDDADKEPREEPVLWAFSNLVVQSSPPASGDEQPVSHGGMACRHGEDRGGEDCGYAASLGQRKRVAHIPTADANAAAGSCLILKDKGTP